MVLGVSPAEFTFKLDGAPELREEKVLKNAVAKDS
jgi:hypothetical protein